MEYLIVPGHAVKAQSTSSGISTLHIQAVHIETGQRAGRVVHNPCRTRMTNMNGIMVYQMIQMITFPVAAR